MYEYETHSQKEIMLRILETRYTDLEQDKLLCEELLCWAQEEGEPYAQGFAYIYLGDYYVAKKDEKQASFYLETAYQIIEESVRDFPDLSTRYYILRGLCFKIQADEQNAAVCYLKARTLAHRVGDSSMECIVLNNLSRLFWQNHHYEEALNYCERAYQIAVDLRLENFLPTLLGGLVELSVELGQMEKAEGYLEKCGQLSISGDSMELFLRRTRCCYCAATAQREEAIQCAEWVLNNGDCLAVNGFTAFENATMLCKCMLLLGEREYTLRFLTLMEEFCGAGLNQLKTLEEKRLDCHLRFDPAAQHPQAYQHYYHQMIELEKQINQTIVNAMKAKLEFEQALEQKETLLAEREYLEQQVNQDELTQIGNRRHFDRLIRSYAEASKPGTAVIMVDVDFFKEYNDHYGHVKGDQALQAVADCLQKNRTVKINPCRYGGDEFVCVCEGISREEVETYLHSIRKALSAKGIPHARSHCETVLTLSIGYAAGKAEEVYDPHLQQQRADQALYAAKNAGRNTYRGKHS